MVDLKKYLVYNKTQIVKITRFEMRLLYDEDKNKIRT